jgi:predicted alpha/beta-hydrolase family hydrolase
LPDSETTAPAPAASPVVSPLVWTVPDRPPIGRILLAHGAGAGWDTPFLNRLAAALAAEGVAVARFNFPYMAVRANGKRRPPPKAETLVEGFLATVATFLAAPEGADVPALIAGKSMGGRIATMALGEDALPPAILGAVAYGYPFRPQDGGEWRLGPIEAARRPLLICQGERDTFGGRAELEALTLPPIVTLHWVEDGSHDFGPRGSSPATLAGNIVAAAAATTAFLSRLALP